MFESLSNLKKHPPGLAVLFFTEMAERFSFYTMRSLLVLYMTTQFGLSDAAAGQVYGLWGLFTWFTPVGGGLLADRFLGTVKTVFWGGVVFFFGHLILGLTDFAPRGAEATVSPAFWMFCVGLLVVAAGNGFFKGNISVLVGTMYDREDRRALRDQAFQIFYIGINLGAFVAPITAPIIRDRFGWGIAFGSAAAAILLSFGTFALGRRFLTDRPPARQQRAEERVPLTPQHRAQMGAIFVVLLASAAFWAIYFQDAYALTLFANRHTDLEAWGWSAENFLSINPFCIFALSPLFVWLWAVLNRKGLEPSTPMKMTLGIASLGMAMLVMVIASLQAEAAPGGRVSPFYLGATYVFCSIGELMFSPIGLSLITKYAPPGWTGLFMGFWFGSLAIGNYVTGALGLLPLSLTGFYGVMAGGMFVMAFLLFLCVKKLNKVLRD